MNKPLFLVISLPLVFLAYWSNLGFFSVPSLVILLIIYLFFILFEFKAFTHSRKKPDFAKLLIYLLLFSVLLNLSAKNSLYVERPNFELVVKLFLGVQMAAAFSYFFYAKYLNVRFLLILISSGLSQVFAILMAPSPRIDVFVILQEAGLMFLNGKNPYSAIFSQVYPQRVLDYYSYFPFSFIVFLPSKIIFGDVRYLLVIINISTAFVVFYFAKKKAPKIIAELLGILFLVQPYNLFILGEARLEPLILFFMLFFSILFLNVERYKFISYSVLSLTIAIKQNFVFLIFFILRFLKNSRSFKNLFSFVLPAAILVTPFLVVDAGSFIEDTFIEPSNRGVRFDSLSLFSLIRRFFVIPNDLLFFLFLIFQSVLFVRKTRGSLFNFFYQFSFFTLGFNLFFKESFLNHYYFLGSVMLLSLAVYFLENPNAEEK